MCKLSGRNYFQFTTRGHLFSSTYAGRLETVQISYAQFRSFCTRQLQHVNFLRHKKRARQKNRTRGARWPVCV